MAGWNPGSETRAKGVRVASLFSRYSFAHTNNMLIADTLAVDNNFIDFRCIIQFTTKESGL